MGVVWGVWSVVVPVLKCAFVIGGEAVAATRVLAGRGGDLGQISVAIDQETSPAVALA
jgi:hypothetical protein